MSRDGNGNYTPPLNPVIGGQPIEADWANDTINDLAAALTDSLSRSGNGNMLAPFRATDGTITIPSISFTNEPNSGLYRAGTGDYRLCVNGKDKARVRDVNGMAAFQVFDLAGTGAWETLATSAEVGAITLADVLAVGNTTGGTDIVVGDGDSIVFNAFIDDFCSIETNIVGPATNLDFQLGDDDGDAFRFKFDHFGAAGGYLDALKIKPDVNVVARDKFIVDVTGTVNAESLDVTGTATAAALAAGSLSSTSNLILSANGGAAVLGVNNTANVSVNAAGNQIAISTGAAGVGVGKIVVSETSVTVYEDMDVTGTVEADGFSGTGTVAITDFVTDVSTNDNDTTVPTTAAVKSYVDTAGGNETLAETLALGNSTGANDIEMTDGAEITSSQQNGISLNSTTGFKVVSGTTGVFAMGQTGVNIGITNISGIPGLPPGSLILATGQGNPTNSAMICNATDVKFYDNIRLNSSSVNILSDDDIYTKHNAGDETALQSSGGEHRVQATETFAALYYGVNAANTAVKIQTSDTGVTVTGTVDLDNLTIATAQGTAGQVLKSTGSGIEWAADSGGGETLAETLALGNASGGNDIVMGPLDAITGQTNNPVRIKNGSGGFSALQTSGDFARVAATETAVTLYYGATAGSGAKKLETVDAGVDITGKLTADEIAAPNSYVLTTSAVMTNSQNWNGQQVWNKYAGNSTLTLATDAQAPVGFSTTISVLSSGFTMTITPDTGDTIKYLDPLTSTWSGTINADLVVGSGGVIELIRTAVSEWTVYGSGVV